MLADTQGSGYARLGELNGEYERAGDIQAGGRHTALRQDKEQREHWRRGEVVAGDFKRHYMCVTGESGTSSFLLIKHWGHRRARTEVKERETDERQLEPPEVGVVRLSLQEGEPVARRLYEPWPRTSETVIMVHTLMG